MMVGDRAAVMLAAVVLLCALVFEVTGGGSVTIQYTKINTNPTEYVQSSSLTTKSVSLTTLRRTNWCSQWNYVRSGADPLYALNGRNVTAAITATDPFYLNMSSTTGFPASGYMFDVLAEVARRGKFNWVFVFVDGYGNVATKELAWLQKVLPRVDMVVNKPYTDLATDRAAGVGYTQSLLDASLVLITVQTSGRSAPQWFSFLKPFNTTLWACILAVIIFQGVAHYVMNPVWRADGSKVSLFIVIFKSLGTFTGSTSQGPVRPGASIVQMGYSFFLLILLSAYTANLTSFFVVVPNYITPYVNIDDANARGASICSQNGTAAFSVLQTGYKNIQIVPVSKKFTPTQLLQQLTVPDSKCTGVVLAQNDWAINQVNAAVNPYCNLVQVGPSIRNIDSGWPYLVDYNRNCTSLVEAAVSEALVSMTLDGTLDSLFYDRVSMAANIDCSGATTDNLQSSQLTEVSMAGVFLIYCAFVFFAIASLFVQMLYAYRKKLKQDAAEKVAAEAEGEEGGAEGDKEGPRGGREGGDKEKERDGGETKAPEGEEGPPATAGRPKSTKKGGGGGGGGGDGPAAEGAPAGEGAPPGDDGWGSFWLSPFGLGATGPSADPDKPGPSGEGVKTPQKTVKKSGPEEKTGGEQEKV